MGEVAIFFFVIVLVLALTVMLPIMAMMKVSGLTARVRVLERRLEAALEQRKTTVARQEHEAPAPQSTVPGAVSRISRDEDTSEAQYGAAAQTPVRPAAGKDRPAVGIPDSAASATSPVHKVPVELFERLPGHSEAASSGGQKQQQKWSAPEESGRSGSRSRTRAEWESFVGGKLLNRIGALALFLGVAFFLKYAFDNNWISETLRVVLGGITGAGLLVLADRMRLRKFEIFAQGLVGGGLAILYLSVYASFNFYHLVPQLTAFIMMTLVTAVAFWYALRYNAVVIALLGLFGGFATPFLLSTGQSNAVGLFSYLLIIDIGILAIVWYKREWRAPEVLAYAFTILWYILWFGEAETGAAGEMLSFGTGFGFLTLFWLLFTIPEVIRLWQGQPQDSMRQALSGVNTFFYYVYTYILFEEFLPDWEALAPLVLAAILIGLVYVVQRKNTRLFSGADRMIVQALILLVICVFIQFRAYEQSIALSLLAALYFRAAFHFRFKAVFPLALLQFFLAIGALLILGNQSTAVVEIPLFNLRAVAYLVLVGAFGWALHTLERRTHTRPPVIQESFYWLAALLFLAFCAVEIYTGFDTLQKAAAEAVYSDKLGYYKYLLISAVWYVYGLGLFWWSAKTRRMPLLYCSAFILSLTIISVIIHCFHYVPIQDFTLLLNERAGLLLLVILGLYPLYRYTKRLELPGTTALYWRGATALAALCLGLEFISVEVYDFFGSTLASLRAGEESEAKTVVILDMQNQRQLWLSLVWLVYSIALMAAGFMKRAVQMRYAAIALFGISILKIFLHDLSYLETLYRIFSFIVLGILLLVVSYLYARYKEYIIPPKEAEAPGEG